MGLNWRRFWSDTLAFERLWAAAHHQETVPPDFQQAVDLYRGPFLAGFSLSGSPEFETWAAMERQNWENRYLEVLSALIDLQGIASLGRPPIMCLDNLQWLDKATMSYLGYLARHLEGASILVVGAYRTGEAASVAAIRAELLRLDVLEEIRLPGLTREAVWRLIQCLSLQIKGAKRLSQRLHRETGSEMFTVLQFVLLAEAYAKAGQVEQGLVAVDQALHVVQHTGERFYEPEAHRIREELLLTQDEVEQAKACFRRALEAARRQGARSWELRAAMNLGRLMSFDRRNR